MKTVKDNLLILFVFLSYVVMLFIVSLTTTWGLSPWATLPEQPATLNGWQLALNQFFDVGVGRYLFGVIVMGVSLYIWKKNHFSQSTALMIIAGNLVFAMLFGYGLQMASWLNRVLFPFSSYNYIDDIGYHLAIIPAVIFFSLSGILCAFLVMYVGREQKTAQ